LTTSPWPDDSPAWSPDGRTIAFQRFTTEHKADVYVIPALGGAERRIAADVPARATGPQHLSSPGNLGWSPDGKWLACGGYPWQEEAKGLWLIKADGSQKRHLTETNDWAPSFSPDGRRLAFVRNDGGLWAIYVVPLASDLTPEGPGIRVTPEGVSVRGLAWMPDGRGIVFSSSGHFALSRLQRIALPSGTGAPTAPPEPLVFGEQGTGLSISKSGRLVYSAQVRDTGIWKITIAGAQSSVAGPLAPSTFDEHTAVYSPDGKRLAFASTRSGAEEIWASDADGSNPVQLTNMNGPMCANPTWAPDGRAILFHSRREGAADVYVLRPESGDIRRITDHEAEDAEPRWSRDGRTIYFGSDRTGRSEIWKVPASGGSPTRMTQHGGATAVESTDGKFIYYAKDYFSPTSIWRMPIAGGEETHVVDGLSYSLNFAVGDRGIYFLAAGEAPQNTALVFLELATGKRTTLRSLGKQWWFGLALSPDQRSLLFSTVDSAGSNLMVVDRFE
jgi:dipeptidyl aminopeptidase/acylaminoacyl peptidase